MNKKDLKELAKAHIENMVDADKIPIFSRDDFRAAVRAVAAELAKSRPPAKDERTARLRDPLWWEMYVSVVGGQVGWLAAATGDGQKFEKRLRTLADISQAAANYAIKIGKVSPKA